MTRERTAPGREPGAVRTPGIVVRRVTRADAKAFLSLVDALADYEKLTRPGGAAKERLIRDCTGTAPKFVALLAFRGGRAAGYAVFFETYSTFLARPTLYLEDLFVLPGLRGEGIGLRLFRECVAAAKRRGCGRMDWTVLDWNRSAARFYRKLGASRLREWQLFRLTREEFARTAGDRGRPAGGRTRRKRRTA